jgi:CPA2 family monovalent cation:H+ antiporter-2
MVEIPTIPELLIWLSLLFSGAVVINLLMRRFNIPSVLGFILIGMIVGPSGLDIITNIDFIDLFAQLGIVILLFTIGLEFNFQKLRSIGDAIIIITLVEVTTMFFLGFLVSNVIGFNTIESLYIAAILAMSSTAIIVKLLYDNGIFHTKESNTIIGVLIVEDIVSVLLIVILGDIVKAIQLDLLNILLIIGQTVAFFIITLIIGLKVIPKVINYIERTNLEEAPLLSSLALGFGLAFLANLLGLNIALGAFIMGMIISSTKRAEIITNKVLPLRDFFISIFFISIGMLIDISTISNHILLAIPITIIAILGKFFSNYIAAYISGHDRLGASTIGVMMVPRGEFSFIIAKQGVDLGLRSILLPFTVIVSLASIISMPLLLRIFPTIMDARTIFTDRFFTPLESIGSIFNSIIIYWKNISRNIFPRLIANIAIIISVIAILHGIEIFISSFYNTFKILQIISYDLFKLVITIVVIVYPIFNIYGKSRSIIEHIFNMTHFYMIKNKIVGKSHYRIIINIIIMVLLLLLSNLILYYIKDTIEPFIIILSIIFSLLFVYTFLDMFFVIHKRLEDSIISLLFNPENKKDE